MEKVIFDTNFLLEKRLKNFFGKQDELKKFASVTEIIIPDMVIKELVERYKRDFTKETDKFFKTLLTNILEHDAKEVNIDDKIEALRLAEIIKFTVIDLKDPKYLFEIKELALKKEPPFIAQDGSDKGFKDAYIYFTVLEYLQEIDDKYIFFVTDDDLLRIAFEKHPNIYVVKNYDEFKEKSIGELFDDYFIEKLQNEIDTDITKNSLITYWISARSNQILIIEVNGQQYIIEIDSGEIISYKEVYAYWEDVAMLLTSRSWDNTIFLIKKLKEFSTYFREETIFEILTALVNNSQIRGTVGAGNYTIDFMGEIYDIAGDKLPIDIKEKIPERVRTWRL